MIGLAMTLCSENEGPSSDIAIIHGEFLHLLYKCYLILGKPLLVIHDYKSRKL